MVFSSIEPRLKEAILGAVMDYDERLLGEGYACVSVADRVVGITYEPESLVVNWILQLGAQLEEDSHPLRSAA